MHHAAEAPTRPPELLARALREGGRVLTVDFRRLTVGRGDRVLDLGCGFGRHAFAAAARGAEVVAVDRAQVEVDQVRAAWTELRRSAPEGADVTALRADLLTLPFADGAFDVVIAAEVLEHIPGDEAAMAEIARVVRPGGRVAVTVPRFWPERICWVLSPDYRRAPGGHVRIYRRRTLVERLEAVGLKMTQRHHAHALHAPYWWLNCAFGETSRASRAYHQMLVWDIEKGPLVTRVADIMLNPVLGKSLVVYAEKPATPSALRLVA
jgi:SAM-dependent methyltransferase